MRTRTLLMTAVVIATLVAAASAGQYVSLNGKFKISYPEDWRPVDYRVVDSVLFSGQQYTYEVVLAPIAATAFEDGDYVVVTLDAGARYDARTIDSTLDVWKNSLNHEIRRYGAGDDFTPSWQPDYVEYWPKTSLASVCTEAKTDQGDHTRSQLVVKFGERGSANFYFYGPDSTWNSFIPVVKSIIDSYSTEGLDAAMSHEQVKVVDAEQLKSRSIDSPSTATSKRTLSFVIFGGIAVVLIVIVAARAARRKKSGAASNS